jgi:hypothetical protein
MGISSTIDFPHQYLPMHSVPGMDSPRSAPPAHHHDIRPHAAARNTPRFRLKRRFRGCLLMPGTAV